MMRRAPSLAALAVIAGLLVPLCGNAAGARAGGRTDGARRASALAAYGRLQLAFEPNVGQSGAPVRFLARSAGSTLFLTPHEAVIALAAKRSSHAHALRLQFPGASHPSLAAADPLPGRVNYLVGNDRSRWRTDVATYGRVRYAHLWPGIDAVFYGTSSRLEYDLTLEAHADPDRIALRFAGTTRQRIDSSGALVLTLPGGAQARELAPVAYQLAGGHRHAVASRFVLAGGTARLALGRYDRGLPLTVDPAIDYATYLGGSGSLEEGNAIAVDSAGDAYVTGFTESTDFSKGQETPLQEENHGGVNAFVTKLNPAGSAFVYSTYLGGSVADYGKAIAVDSQGEAYVAGTTYSADFPTKNPEQEKCGDEEEGGKHEGKHCTHSDAFVAKLNATGSAVVYSTYLGGSGADEGNGIAVSATGDAYVVGTTTSPDFPTKNAEQEKCADREEKGKQCTLDDTFVAKLGANGKELEFSTYLGGESYDVGLSVALDSAGNAYVTGWTFSAKFPTKNPEQAACGVEQCLKSDAFVTKLSPAGALVYSTYLGGTGLDTGTGIAVNAAGDAYISGWTESPNFPTKNAMQPSCGDPRCIHFDAYVSELDASGSALVFSTYLGGAGQDLGRGIAVDSQGAVYVTGGTSSSNFPTLDAAQPVNGGREDSFVAKFTAAGALVYSTYFGGSGVDQARGIAVDAAGAAYIVGHTSSDTDFPVKHAAQPRFGGGLDDVFIAKLSPPDTTPPTSSAVIPLCHGAVSVTVTDNEGGSGPRAVRYRVDGGPSESAATSGNPGVVSITVPEGNHVLEYSGEDAAGNLESPHVASVRIDTTPPEVSITSDQGVYSYEIGDHASVTIRARDATSGLAADPSRPHVPLTTSAAGHFNASLTATDRCGTAATARFAYAVISDPSFASSVDLESRAGTVTVSLPGAAAQARAGSGGIAARASVVLLGARQVPVGSIVDASAGEVALTASAPSRGALQKAILRGGRFEVLQPRSAHGLVVLHLLDATSRRVCKRARRTFGLLTADARGDFRVRGQNSSATSRGSDAVWTVEDRCAGTLTNVARGSVTVRVLRTGKTKRLSAGSSRLVGA